MSNLKVVRDEFNRQAGTFDTWAVKTDEKSGERFSASLGDCSKGEILMSLAAPA